MFFDLVIYSQMIFMSFLLLVFIYKYMLVLLMFMELLVLNMALVMFFVFSFFKLEFFLVYYLVFSVCEGVLGLSLLVMIVRFYGSELYYMFNISKF